MDDTPSRQQIDELADLYLTDPAQDSPVSGPTPIKLSPKVGDAAASPTNERNENDFVDTFDDSHPVLRLTEEEAEELSGGQAVAQMPPTSEDESNQPPATNEPAPRAVLEAVLMGNLPGMSGPWLTQYAQLLAQNEGPVVLLHVSDEAIDLELVEPRAEAQPAPIQPATTVRIPPMRGGRTGLVGLIDALVRSESTPARTILVRFDTFTDKQTLSRLAAMDDWTLLCGSDGASIAAASRSLRSAVHSDPRLADRHVGVMIMGSDDDAADQAAKRIAHELEDDLVNPVELIGHLRRMQPVQVRDLGSFPDPVALWPKLVSFFDSLEMPEPLAVPEPAPAPEATPKPEPMPAPPKPRAKAAQAPPHVPPKPRARPAASRPEPTPRFRQAKPKPQAAPTPPQQAPTRQRTAAQPSQPNVGTPMRPAPTPRVLAPQPELDLIALIGQGTAALDNPVALQARIPEQPDTQLAVDAQGTVHILAQAEADFNQSVMRLIEAGHWVNDHLELIALTQRDRDFVDTQPVLHLLTDRADLTTQVVGKLAGQIKLHLLQQVKLGRESGWFCTPLG
jgi:outer membrane biosynthesis protein TonB